MGSIKIVSPIMGVRRLFYAVSPNETSFETLAEVPNYVNEAVPYFLVFIVLEAVTCLLRGRQTFRWNDLFSSVAAGIQSETSKVIFRGGEISAYIYVYQSYRLVTLPWDSPGTWLLCFLGVDLGYYWFHRAAHEVNLIWAAHQVHHSSEDYNLSTALRQSTVQTYTSWVFYLPLALGIPPSVFLVHQQFNLLYQFWIHTEVVYKLGPVIEYIVNTPSHHRVHHGRNPYCIDKNYGGTLIIWDRMFGTFQEEGEKVAYGLTHPLNTWDPIWTQVCHYIHIIKGVRDLPGWKNKLSVIFKGPGWVPGKPRLGDPQDIPQITYPVSKYDSHLPLISTLYVASHFLIVVISYQELVARKAMLSGATIFYVISYILYSLVCFGALFDNRHYSSHMECIRCALYLVLHHTVITHVYQTTSLTTSYLLNTIQVYFAISLAVWAVRCVRDVNISGSSSDNKQKKLS